MFYSVVLKRNYPSERERALAHAEHYSAKRKALNAVKDATPRITERSSSWVGTPTPEDSPPCVATIPKEVTYIKDYK